jgi:hypothetical protein
MKHIPNCKTVNPEPKKVKKKETPGERSFSFIYLLCT